MLLVSNDPDDWINVTLFDNPTVKKQFVIRNNVKNLISEIITYKEVLKMKYLTELCTNLQLENVGLDLLHNLNILPLTGYLVSPLICKRLHAIDYLSIHLKMVAEKDAI